MWGLGPFFGGVITMDTLSSNIAIETPPGPPIASFDCRYPHDIISMRI